MKKKSEIKEFRFVAGAARRIFVYRSNSNSAGSLEERVTQNQTP